MAVTSAFPSSTEAMTVSSPLDEIRLRNVPGHIMLDGIIGKQMLPMTQGSMYDDLWLKGCWELICCVFRVRSIFGTLTYSYDCLSLTEDSPSAAGEALGV